MHYVELKEKLSDFTIFSLSDIRKIEHTFHRRRRNEWQDKGYIKKIIRGYYIFSDLEIDEKTLFEIANRIYSPSYISFEMALSRYGLIPESIYSITSASSRKTRTFRTKIANFIYKTVKPELFFGYVITGTSGKIYKIASCEKALLDYFYLNPSVKKPSDFESIRVQKDVFRKTIDGKKLREYLERFKNKALTKRVSDFLKFIKHA
jgi:predicted transcriptional regulator of viral defense system